jgi:hypothetical protein
VTFGGVADLTDQTRQKSFHLPVTAVKKKKLIKTFENINSIISTVPQPQIDTRVSFLMPGSTVAAATLVFGLVGGATTAFFDWQSRRNVERLFKDSPLSSRDGKDNIINILKKNRWQFRVIQ